MTDGGARMGKMPEVSSARQALPGAPAESVLEAVLERVTYANEETGYTIAWVATERGGGDPSLIKLVRTGRAVLDGLETVSTSVGSGRWR